MLDCVADISWYLRYGHRPALGLPEIKLPEIRGYVVGWCLRCRHRSALGVPKIELADVPGCPIDADWCLRCRRCSAFSLPEVTLPAVCQLAGGVSRFLECERRSAFSLPKVTLYGAHLLADTVLLRRQGVGDGFNQLAVVALLVALAGLFDHLLNPGLRRLALTKVIFDDLAQAGWRQTQPRIRI